MGMFWWWFLCCFGGLFWLGLRFGLALVRVSFPIYMLCFLSFYDDLGTPPTWRLHLWKKKSLARMNARELSQGCLSSTGTGTLACAGLPSVVVTTV